MKSFVVLKPNYRDHGERSAKIISDHWRVLGFLVPTFWLIYYRLWFHLAAWVALSIGILMLPMAWAFSAYILTALARYWIALEGPGWYIAKLERNGWTIHQVIEAANQDDAEWMFAHSANADYATDETAPMPKKPIKRPPPQRLETFGLLDMSGPQKA